MLQSKVRSHIEDLKDRDCGRERKMLRNREVLPERRMLHDGLIPFLADREKSAPFKGSELM